MMKIKIKLITIAMTSFILTSCSNFPFTYKIDVAQGNIITQETINQLQPGMSKEQVSKIMGPPILASTFDQDQWNYIYTLEKGSNLIKENKISLFFEQDKLVTIKGTKVPDA